MTMYPECVAELSANHRGDLVTAIRLVTLAAEAGADAIKLQTYTPEEMVGSPFLAAKGGPWDGEPLLKLYGRAYTPRQWHRPLALQAEKLGMQWFSSVFSLDDLAFLETIECPRYKIASFEVVDLELIEAVLSTRKPVVISTGMADVPEISRVLQLIKASGVHDVTMLVCTSAYPTPAAGMNLRRLLELRGLAFRHGAPIKTGLSDHSLGFQAACAATALGVRMIEKHFTDSRANGGPDAEFSAEPGEFRYMVEQVHETWEMLGSGTIGPTRAEQSSVRLRRSLWWARGLKPGARVERADIRSARPANGLPCSELPTILGSRVSREVYSGEPIRAGDVESLNIV